MKKTIQAAALCGMAAFALLLGGCADTGPGYGVGVGYAGYGPYDSPYYGGYGPYYGDNIFIGGGYGHPGYYGGHHVYGGLYRGGRTGRFGGGGGTMIG